MHLQHVRRPGVQVRVQVLLQRPQELQVLALQGPRRGVARRVGLPAPGHAVHDHPHRQHRLQPLRRHAARPLPRERQPPACRWERRGSGGARASVSTLRPRRRTPVAGGGHTAVAVGAGGRPRDPGGTRRAGVARRQRGVEAAPGRTAAPGTGPGRPRRTAPPPPPPAAPRPAPAAAAAAAVGRPPPPPRPSPPLGASVLRPGTRPKLVWTAWREEFFFIIVFCGWGSRRCPG